MSSTSPKSHLMRRRPVVRVVLVLVSLIAAWHIFAQLLWIAPYSAAMRSLVPGNFLTSWQIPFFGQSWSVFAPDPINGNYHFYVRAVENVDGKQQNSEWIDAAEDELKLSRHNLLPPRAAGLANEQASKYRDAYSKLNEKQQEVVQANYYTGADWKSRFETALYKASGDDATARANAGSFITQHAYTSAYATQVAKTMWGEDVTTIRFAISRQNAVPFDQRNNPDAKPEPEQWSPTGWRGTFIMPGQSHKDFADTFKKLAEEK